MSLVHCESKSSSSDSEVTEEEKIALKTLWFISYPFFFCYYYKNNKTKTLEKEKPRIPLT